MFTYNYTNMHACTMTPHSDFLEIQIEATLARVAVKEQLHLERRLSCTHIPMYGHTCAKAHMDAAMHTYNRCIDTSIHAYKYHLTVGYR